VQLKEELLEQYHNHHDTGAYLRDAHAMGKRSLKNLCLAYLTMLDDESVRQLCLKQFNEANNMTDVMGALVALNNIDCAQRTDALDQLYGKWKDEDLVVDKWLSLQATSTIPNTLNKVKTLTDHESFDINNPNKVRALIDMFSRANLINFHQQSGEGYQFLTENILTLNLKNPQIAARSMEPLTRWQKFDETRQALMKQQLERIIKEPKLSKDVYEVAYKSLHVE